ncbi:Ig-like domain repeat protein [Kitasatospora sp. NPDC001683]
MTLPDPTVAVGSFPTGVAIAPDGLHAYVTSNSANTVSVTDTVPFTTATALASAPDPSVFGQAKVLTATVTSVDGIPTGTVSFFDSATLLGTATVVAGVATFTTSAFTVGSHALTAVYSGDTDFNGSTSPVDTQTVTKANTTTTLTATPNPSVFGQPVSLTATVSVVAPGGGIPTGTVTFFIGGIPQAPVTLSGGVATLTNSTLSVGMHSVRATYNPSGSYNTSTSATINQTVAKAGTSTALTSTPNPSVHGQLVSLTATVTATAPGAGTPTGTVSFFDGATLLGTGTLVTGVAAFSTSTLSVGSHSLTAVYAGSTSFNGSTSPIDTQTVV